MKDQERSVDENGRALSVTREGPIPKGNCTYIMRDGSFGDGRTLADMWCAVFGEPKENKDA